MKLLPLPLQRLRECFDYNPVTGVLSDKSGNEVGTPSLGYLVVWVDGRLYRCHRIAWAMFYGISEFPEVDHWNLNKMDNCIGNLRLASRSDNMANVPTQKNNTSGVKGVSWCKWTNKWNATITKDRKRMNLGRFTTVEEAAAAYADAAKEYFGEFARTA